MCHITVFSCLSYFIKVSSLLHLQVGEGMHGHPECQYYSDILTLWRRNYFFNFSTFCI